MALQTSSRARRGRTTTTYIAEWYCNPPALIEPLRPGGVPAPSPALDGPTSILHNGRVYERLQVLNG